MLSQLRLYIERVSATSLDLMMSDGKENLGAMMMCIRMLMMEVSFYRRMAMGWGCKIKKMTVVCVRGRSPPALQTLTLAMIFEPNLN